MRYVCSLILLTLAAASLFAGQPPTQALNAHQQMARAIFKELIEINTTDSTGDCTKAAEAIAARFRAAGCRRRCRGVGPLPKKQNVVARLRGSGAARPILLIAHLDVVEARREDWSFDPFVFIERDGTTTDAAPTTSSQARPCWLRI